MGKIHCLNNTYNENETHSSPNIPIILFEHQCGGQKGCGTIYNMIMMRAVIDNNRRLNRKTYYYFADAYKCFDKLWLKDCLVELWRAGMR